MPDAQTEASTEKTLEIRNISKSFGAVHALKDISFTVSRGEWVAIMGPSGSGKTTMINIVGCMDRPSGGAVILDGEDVAGLSAEELTAIRRDKIGLVFQQFHLIPYLTAVENVMVAQYYHSLVDENEALQALDRVGLLERARHLPRQLSGGEQQRVCIARALINHPKLILADEPTGKLDETNGGIVMALFRRLHAEGSTIVMVTHDPDVAACAEKTIVLEYGRLARITENAPRPAEAEPA